MDIEKIIGEYGDDVDLARWFMSRLVTEQGRNELSELRRHSEMLDQMHEWLSHTVRTGITKTDYVSIYSMSTIADLKKLLLDPTTAGFPADSIFVGSYWPARSAGAFEIGFYGIGQNVVLVSVFGTVPTNSTELGDAVALLGAKNDVNFQTAASGGRTDRAHVHNEVKDHADVNRAEAVSATISMMCWPVPLLDSLVQKSYEYVESDQDLSHTTDAPQPGLAPLGLQSSCPRPMLGFVAQLPVGTAVAPVCVASPCQNQNPTRSPSGTSSIFLRPDLIVLKLYAA
ncbi:MAG: hypothetical protein IT207_08865 [Fimbriimonadaceae bacterium]|nr:hypothetical protein [Fimbriimonadaceae bacterium]